MAEAALLQARHAAHTALSASTPGLLAGRGTLLAFGDAGLHLFQPRLVLFRRAAWFRPAGRPVHATSPLHQPVGIRRLQVDTTGHHLCIGDDVGEVLGLGAAEGDNELAASFAPEDHPLKAGG